MITREHITRELYSTADYSDCERYRYWLSRRWAEGPTIAFVMLNPSTATERDDDPTVARCCERAKRLGYGRLIVVNAFAFRATNPADMKAEADPVGPDNDRQIAWAANIADLVICAWGEHGKHLGRSKAVRELLVAEAPHKIHALHVNQSGEPGHPLYMKYDLQPTPWKAVAHA